MLCRSYGGGIITIENHFKGALYPDDLTLDYHNLEGIHYGGEASAVFAGLTDHTPEEILKIRANLLKYCGLDTFAMVKDEEILVQTLSILL